MTREAPHAGPADGLSFLASVVVSQLDRARTLVDANPQSATYGCADRPYWHYRTLTNFPGASWQQLLLGFAAIYRAGAAGNPYSRDPALLDLISAMLRFWAQGCQNRAGAFDEWYLNEHSFCATAITSAGAGLALHLVGDEIRPNDREIAVAALERAGAWLAGRYNPVVMNQNLAAATALQALAVLTGKDRWTVGARDMLERVEREQSDEGWLPEYSGADLGYSTLSLDQLAAFCSLAGPTGAGAVAQGMAKRLTAFLARVQGAGLAAPGALGSRGTRHHFLYGSLAFAAGNAEAANLAGLWLGALSKGEAAVPADTDDRYFAYFYFPQFAMALLQASRTGVPASIPAPGLPDTADLPESGFLVRPLGRGSVTISSRLGGALAVQGRQAPCRYALGYEVSLADGSRFSSAAWETQPVRMSGDPASGEGLCVEASFRAVKSGIPLRRIMIPFQVLVHLLRSTWLAERFQAFVKNRMVSSKAALPLRLRRCIIMDGLNLHVRDELIPDAPQPGLLNLTTAREISMHSPSAKTKPLLILDVSQAELSRAVDEIRAGRPAVLDWQVDAVAETAASLHGHSAAGA